MGLRVERVGFTGHGGTAQSVRRVLPAGERAKSGHGVQFVCRIDSRASAQVTSAVDEHAQGQHRRPLAVLGQRTRGQRACGENRERERERERAREREVRCLTARPRLASTHYFQVDALRALACAHSHSLAFSSGLVFCLSLSRALSLSRVIHVLPSLLLLLSFTRSLSIAVLFSRPFVCSLSHSCGGGCRRMQWRRSRSLDRT